MANNKDNYTTLRQRLVSLLMNDTLQHIVENKQSLNPSEYIDDMNDCMVRLNNFSPSDLDKMKSLKESDIKAGEMMKLMNRILGDVHAFCAIYAQAIDMIMVSKHSNKK